VKKWMDGLMALDSMKKIQEKVDKRVEEYAAAMAAQEKNRSLL
jgi:hypothetical protein